MRRNAVTLGIALIGLVALPVLAEGTRPRPRPMPVSAPTQPDAKGQQSVPVAPLAPKALPVAAPLRTPGKGSVTSLPLPRFVSLKTGEGNARRGPGLSHRIDWVFTRAGMPLKITAEHEHWRRVEDPEGLGGWVHYSLLSGVRTVMVAKDMATFHAQPEATSSIQFQAEAGVVAHVIECAEGWCRVSADGQKGWAPVDVLWGVAPDEVIE